MHRLLRLAVMGTLLLFAFGCGGGGSSIRPQSLPLIEWLVASSDNGRILRYNALTGEFRGMFAQGGALTHPRGIAVLEDGRVAVGETDSKKVLIFSSTGFLSSEVGPLDGEPRGIVAYNGGFLVSEFDATGAGKISAWTPANGLTTFAEGGDLNGPDGLVIQDGVLYVASQNNAKILTYTVATGAFRSTFATEGALAAPSGLTFGFEGGLFVTQFETNEGVLSGGSVLRFDSDGTYKGVFLSSTGETLSAPTGIAYLPTTNRVTDLPDHLVIASAGTNELRGYNVGGANVLTTGSGSNLSVPMGFALRNVP